MQTSNDPHSPDELLLRGAMTYTAQTSYYADEQRPVQMHRLARMLSNALCTSLEHAVRTPAPALLFYPNRDPIPLVATGEAMAARVLCPHTGLGPAAVHSASAPVLFVSAEDNEREKRPSSKQATEAAASPRSRDCTLAHK
jgi:hypothetical protein